MDHILCLPSSSRPKSIKVPLLTTDEYDHGDFETYPERQEWGLRATKDWDDLFKEPKPEFLAFLQRWLFFGLLDRVFGPRFSIAWFDGGTLSDQRILTTARLPSIARRFLSRVKRMSLEEIAVAGKACNLAHDILRALIPENLGKIKNLDEHSFVSSRTLIRFVRDHLATDPMDPAVSMSIHLTWELIRSVLSKIGQRAEMMDRAINSISPVWTSLPWEFPKEKGWCPSELLIIFKQLNTSGLLFLDQITPLGATMNHQMTSPLQGLDSIHPSTACTRLGCSFKKFPTSTIEQDMLTGVMGV